jgi:hypothetical protein
MLERAAVGKWDKFTPPGEGADYRLDDPELSGCALVWEDGVVIHMQLFPRRGAGQENEIHQWRPRIHRPYMA